MRLGYRFCAFNQQKVRQKDRRCGVFNLKQQDLGRGTSGPNFLKNQKARFSETKAIMKDFIVMKKAIKRKAIKSDQAGSNQKGEKRRLW